ncbi:MAG: hypothetical protein ACSHW0_04370 [Thalassotalea sp.]
MKYLQTITSVILLTLSGCAAFPDEQIAKVENLPDVSQYKNKPSVAIDLKFYRGSPDDANPIEMSQLTPQLQEMTAKVLDESQLFEKYTYDIFEKNEVDYVIKMHFYNHGNTGGAAISGFLSGFTFGIIPGVATDSYSLKLEVHQGDKSIIEQVSNDALNTYIGIWFIPVMANTPEKGFDEVISNMIKDSLTKIIESKQLHYAAVNNLLSRKG